MRCVHGVSEELPCGLCAGIDLNRRIRFTYENGPDPGPEVERPFFCGHGISRGECEPCSRRKEA